MSLIAAGRVGEQDRAVARADEALPQQVEEAARLDGDALAPPRAGVQRIERVEIGF